MNAEDYDQQVEVVYDQVCCTEVGEEIVRRLPRSVVEEPLPIKCPLHETKYEIVRHDDGAYNLRGPLAE